MKKIFIGLLLLMFAVACTNEGCTEEGKFCPDGTAVVRDPDNNCEFPACPEAEFDRWYVSRETEKCIAMTFMCLEGSEQFFDETGCGCQAPGKKYIGDSLEKCSRIKYMCEEGLAPFTDDFGCGCGFDWGLMPEPVPEKFEGKKVTHECKQRSDACTMEYMPVCGWFGKNIQCIKYPCAADYGNPCTACSDEKVEYWTEGECPGDDGFNMRAEGSCDEDLDECIRSCDNDEDCSDDCDTEFKVCENNLV